jgi:hypothetical protein
VTKSTTLSTGPITPSSDMITVELIEPDYMPPVVRVTWPTAPTIPTQPLQRGSRRSHEDLGVRQYALRPNPGPAEMLTRWMAAFGKRTSLA